MSGHDAADEVGRAGSGSPAVDGLASSSSPAAPAPSGRDVVEELAGYALVSLRFLRAVSRRLIRLLRPLPPLARAHPAKATGICWALILLARLYLDGFVGLADNFDGHRLTCQVGVAPHPIPATQPLWAYVTPRYDAYTWYGESCSAGGTGQPYLTTAVIPLWIAKLLTATVGNHVFGLPGALDLRMLGLVYVALAAVGIGWLVHELPGSATLRVLAASGVGLAVADSAIAPNFISPLSDPAGLVGVLYLAPALLRLLRLEHPGWREVLAVTLVTVWTVGAKTQLITVLIGVVPCLLLRATVPIAVRRGRGRGGALGGGRRRIRRFLAARVLGASACLFLVGFGYAYQHTQSRWLNEIVLYDAVFRELLGHSPHVAADLRALHLDPGFARSAGSSVVSADTAAALPIYPDFLANASFGDELRFYAHHPARLFGVADRGLVGMSDPKPSYLGNYPASAGNEPYQKECRVCVAEFALTMAEPARLIVYPVFWLGSLVLGLAIAVAKRRHPAARSAAGTLAALAAGTGAQFWLVMLGDGDSDLQKHMVFTVLGTCMLGPLLLATAIGYDHATVVPLPAPRTQEPESDIPVPHPVEAP